MSVELQSLAARCPGRPELAAFNLGKLPLDRLEVIAAHLADCSSCDALLGELQHHEEDSLISRLAGCTPGAGPDEEPGCAALEERVRALDLSLPGQADTFPPQKTAGGAGDFPMPAQVGPYQILETIGRGGNGVVYKARQAPVDRLVALKMISAGAHAGPQALARFRVEGQAIARLRHPNVIQIYEFGEYDGLPYFSMELAEGGSLSARLARGPLEARAAAELVRTLARAVHAMHEQQVLHRDLKPGNVLLAADGTPKVTDFGLAKLLDSDDGQTATEAILGTPSYMAPEQAHGRIADVGPAADVYALGAILYEALTGQPPFRAEGRRATLELVRAAAPVAPANLRPGLPPDLEAVCLKCLEKAPGRRYASAADLADDLDRWLAGEPTVARPPRWPMRAWRAFRRHRVAAALVPIVLGVAVAVYLLNPNRPLHEIERALGRGEPVTLIGGQGEPRWFRVRAGEESTKVSLAANGSFGVHTLETALVELVRDPMRSRYRIRAQVRHGRSIHLSQVGVYFSHRAHPGPGTDLHVFVQLCYNDIDDERDIWKKGPPKFRNAAILKGNHVKIEQWIYGRGKRQDGNLGHSCLAALGAIFQPAGAAGGDWRDLEVVVTPESIRGYRDGQLVGEVSVRQINQQFRTSVAMLCRGLPGHPPYQSIPAQFEPRGALGLYVLRGSAYFRSVVIEPLPDPE